MDKQKQKESFEKFKLAHSDYFKEYSRKYFQEHKEKLLLYHREYYKNHKAEFNEYFRRWRQGHREQFNAYHRRRRELLKMTTLTHYGNGKCACVLCGESRPACLSIDHIEGGGTKHRRLLHSSHNFYSWLVSHNLPKGYQTLCMNCQWIKRALNREVA